MKNRLLIFIKIFVSAGLIYYLLHQNGIESILEQLVSAKLSWIIIGIVIFSLSNLLGSFQWFLLLKQAGVKLKYFQVVRYYYIGLFFNNIFISNMGGDFFRIYYITRHQNNSSAAVSTVFLDRFLGFSMLTFLAITGGIYWIGSNEFSKIWPVLSILMVIWIFVIIIMFNRKLGSFMRFILQWFVPEKLLIKLREIYNIIYYFSKNKRLVLFVFFISLFIQIIRIFIHYVAGKAVGVQADFVSFLIFIPLIALLASLPISIGGLGVREQSGVILFQRVGVQKALSISMEFLAYIITIVGSLPGILFFVFIDKRRNNSEEY